MISDEKRREVAERMREKMYLFSESDLREISDEYNADYNKPLMEQTEWLAAHEYKEWTGLMLDGWNPIEAIGGFCQALHVDCSVCEGPEEWLSKALDEIKPRLMPEGMEWPRYTDGEPVRPMDTVYARIECGPGARRKPKKITQLAFADPTEATVRVEYNYMSGYEPNDTWGFRRVPEMKLPYEKEE